MRRDLILVAEDNATLRFLARKQLASLGYQCDVVENGKQAVERVKTTKYAVIFMDVHMPQMDGLEAAQAIRASEEELHKPKTPIIAMTANPDKQTCFKAGMSDFIFKPVTLEGMRRALSLWLPAR